MNSKDYYVTPDDGYEDQPHRSVKKTKNWCKGKVGTKHVGKWEAYRPGDTVLKDWTVFVCQTCRKYLKMNYPSRHYGKS